LKSKGIDVGAGVKKTTDTFIEGMSAIAMATVNVTFSAADKATQNENV
jgi:hypothetical protein